MEVVAEQADWWVLACFDSHPQQHILLHCWNRAQIFWTLSTSTAIATAVEVGAVSVHLDSWQDRWGSADLPEEAVWQELQVVAEFHCC
jgi:GMP synthase-like glutamine amidotransferase